MFKSATALISLLSVAHAQQEVADGLTVGVAQGADETELEITIEYPAASYGWAAVGYNTEGVGRMFPSTVWMVYHNNEEVVISERTVEGYEMPVEVSSTDISVSTAEIDDNDMVVAVFTKPLSGDSELELPSGEAGSQTFIWAANSEPMEVQTLDTDSTVLQHDAGNFGSLEVDVVSGEATAGDDTDAGSEMIASGLVSLTMSMMGMLL